MSNDDSPRTLLLTGASRGIGHATVKKFAAEGWRVISCSRQAFSPYCPWPGGERDHIQVDLSDPQQTMEAVATVKERLAGGRLDALVNNAGISPKGPEGERLSTLDTDLRDWGKVFHVNVFASVVLGRGLKDELARAKGAIVNVGSIEGLGNNPRHPAYGASKAGLHGLTRAIAVDHGPDGVRCNAVAPGWIDTPLNNDFIESMPDPAAFRRQIGGLHPVGRTGSPEDVAQLICFLASEDAAFITGQVMTIDGGRMTRLSLP